MYKRWKKLWGLICNPTDCCNLWRAYNPTILSVAHCFGRLSDIFSLPHGLFKLEPLTSRLPAPMPWIHSFCEELQVKKVQYTRPVWVERGALSILKVGLILVPRRLINGFVKWVGWLWQRSWRKSHPKSLKTGLDSLKPKNEHALWITIRDKTAWRVLQTSAFKNLSALYFFISRWNLLNGINLLFT